MPAFGRGRFPQHPEPEDPFSAAEVAQLRQEVFDETADVENYLTLDPSDRDGDTLHEYMEQLAYLQDAINALRVHLHYNFFITLQHHLSGIIERVEAAQAFAARPPFEPAVGVPSGTHLGRTRLDIPDEVIERLFDAQYTYAHMASILGCSERHVRYRLEDLNMFRREYSVISDEDLCDKIRRIRQVGTHLTGVAGCKSSLETEFGIKVPRWRVEECLRFVDPEGAAIRLARICHRREYYVPYVNSLWHIDGHHKLNRWGIVIHMAVDGKSRMVVFGQAVNNNRAYTVLGGFKRAVREFGWPSRVRADKGGELLRVRDLMVWARGEGRGSFIRGMSVHNQRIERAWVDLQAWQTSRWEAVFEWLEREGLLKVDDPVCMWCFHFCYLEAVDLSVQRFQRQWNNHGLRTENYRSPVTIWRQCVIEAELEGYHLDADTLADDHHPATFGATMTCRVSA